MGSTLANGLNVRRPAILAVGPPTYTPPSHGRILEAQDTEYNKYNGNYLCQNREKIDMSPSEEGVEHVEQHAFTLLLY